MTIPEKKSVELKLRVVAAEAESLCEDLRSDKLREGDCSRRIGIIYEALNAAREAARFD